MSAIAINTLEEPFDSKQIELAHATFAHHAKSFRLAANFLPKDNLDDIAVLYHFCRLVDDVVDEAPSIEQANQNIFEIEEILCNDDNRSTYLDAFKEVLHKHDIAWHAVKALMEGCNSDLHPVRVENAHELGVYCYRVAGSVGEMMSPLINVTEPEATQYAIDLGLGMQITNICRDVLEDAERGRVYIPATWLEKVGLTHQDILHQSVSPRSIAQVIHHMLEVADVCYRRAYIGCRYIPFRSRLGILIARRVYRAIGLKLIKHHETNPFHGRTMLSKWEKLWQVGLGFLDALHPITLGWWKPKIPESPFYNDFREIVG